jgi:hypothetical protein
VTGGAFEPVRGPAPPPQAGTPAGQGGGDGGPTGEPPIPRREDTQPIPIPPGADGGAGGMGAGGVPPEELPPGAPPPGGPPPPPGPLAGLPRFGRSAWVALAVTGALVLFVIMFFAVNATVASNAEQRAEDEAAAALGVPVDVRLQGFPVGIRLLVGSPVDARLSARDVPIEGSEAVLDRLEIDARDVVLDRAGDGAIRAERATFSAELDDDNVQQLLGVVGRLPLTDIELANGVARLSVVGFRLIDATADVRGGDVVFTITSPLGSLDFLGDFTSLPLQLGELPLGFEVTDVEIGRGVLRVRGAASDVLLEDPQG